jgi:hypothetical protein
MGRRTLCAKNDLRPRLGPIADLPRPFLSCPNAEVVSSQGCILHEQCGPHIIGRRGHGFRTCPPGIEVGNFSAMRHWAQTPGEGYFREGTYSARIIGRIPTGRSAAEAAVAAGAAAVRSGWCVLTLLPRSIVTRPTAAFPLSDEDFFDSAIRWLFLLVEIRPAFHIWPQARRNHINGGQKLNPNSDGFVSCAGRGVDQWRKESGDCLRCYLNRTTSSITTQSLPGPLVEAHVVRWYRNAEFARCLLARDPES